MMSESEREGAMLSLRAFFWIALFLLSTVGVFLTDGTAEIAVGVLQVLAWSMGLGAAYSIGKQES